MVSNAATRNNSLTQAPLLQSFKPSQAAEIKFTYKGSSAVILRKKDDAWTVIVNEKAYPASKAKIESFLNRVADLRQGKLISTDKTDVARFDLDAQHANTISITDAQGKHSWSFSVGKAGSSGFEDYVQISKDSRIFLAESAMNFYTGQEASYWFDLMVFPDDVTGSSIKEISISGSIPTDADRKNRKKEQYSIKKLKTTNADEWILAEGTAALDQARVSTFCNRLAVLQGINFSEDRNTSSDFAVSITTEKGTRYSISGKALQHGDQYQITRANAPFAYIVNVAALVRAVVPLESLISQQK
ncbi:MAG: DUF4340 domain-containing protein [Rectinema subterraneum]|uniref:DUF4340 domain-containing protein n=1 Tax=Rectinema subterraneum TaxID=2653714 RepID=UPI003C7E6581